MNQSIELTKYSESVISLLEPLKEGCPVTLSIDDEKMRSKKRIPKPILMIAPTSLYGADDGNFLFSMPGFGSEIMGLDNLKASRLFMMGMTMQAATMLVHEIKSLFK